MPKYRVMCYRQGVWDGQEARIIEERVEFLDYFRFMMRAIANPYLRITSAARSGDPRYVRAEGLASWLSRTATLLRGLGRHG